MSHDLASLPLFLATGRADDSTNYVLDDVSVPGHPGNRLVIDGVGNVAAMDMDKPLEGRCIRFDARAWIALPPMAEPHVHLDKTFFGSSSFEHLSSAPPERKREHEQALMNGGDGVPNILERASLLVERFVSRGALSIRSHVDITPSTGLSRMEAMLALRERMKGIANLQLVAFPQEGVLGATGVAELLDESLKLGADAVGGFNPAMSDGDVSGQLNAIFTLAEKHGVPVDIHVHEVGVEGRGVIASICEETSRRAMEGRVTIAHGYGLATAGSDELRRLAELLSKSGVSLVSSLPARPLIPPIAELMEMGVNVAVGSDNISDLWTPFGSGDPLERVLSACHAIGWKSIEQLHVAFSLVTENASRAIGIAASSFGDGRSRDVVLVRARTVGDSVVSQPPSRIIIRSGRVVASGGRIVSS